MKELNFTSKDIGRKLTQEEIEVITARIKEAERIKAEYLKNCKERGVEPIGIKARPVNSEEEGKYKPHYIK